MTRIVHVTDGYLPRVGGIELHVQDLALRQRAGGDDARVVTGTPASAGADRDPAWVCRTTPPDARRLLAAYRPDVVHVHLSVVSPYAIQVGRDAAELELPLVATVHSLWTGWGPVPHLAVAALGRARTAAVWSAVSRPAAAAVAAVLGRDVPVAVVGNAVDPIGWRPDRLSGAARPSGDRPVTVVSVMRLTRTKRTLPLAEILLAARAGLAPDVPLRAVVVGDGPLRPRLERRLERAGASSWVRLAGGLDRPEVRRELEGADVFLAPAEREAFGIAALEARTAGLAVVASARSGIADFVRHGREGLLAEDDTGMAAALVDLAADPALLDRIRRHNALEPPAHDWRRALDTVAALYDVARGVPLGSGPARVA